MGARQDATPESGDELEGLMGTLAALAPIRLGGGALLRRKARVLLVMVHVACKSGRMRPVR